MNPAQVTLFPIPLPETRDENVIHGKMTILSATCMPLGKTGASVKSFWKDASFLMLVSAGLCVLGFGDFEFLFGKARIFVLHLCVLVWGGFPRTELMFRVYSSILPMNSFYGHWYISDKLVPINSSDELVPKISSDKELIGFFGLSFILPMN